MPLECYTVNKMTFYDLSIFSIEQLPSLVLMMNLRKEALLLGETDLCNGDHIVCYIHMEKPGLDIQRTLS